jgi:hypothetical protein
MDIWQRGTSFTNTSYAYSADRWLNFRGAFASGMTTTRQNSGLTSIQYCARIARNSGNTSLEDLNFQTALETSDSIRFAGKNVIVSFYARAGANYSSASSALTAIFYTGTGTDQATSAMTGGPWTGAANTTSTVTLTTSWQRFTFTVAVGSSVSQVGFRTAYIPVGTAGANDYFEVTGVQVELGSTATTFSRTGGTIQGELAACQRYYYRQTAVAGSSSNYSGMALGFNTSTTVAVFYVKTPVTLRTVPSSIDFSTLVTSDVAASNFTVTALAFSGASSTTDTIVIETTVASGQTQYRPAVLRANNSTTAFLGFSAEL